MSVAHPTSPRRPRRAGRILVLLGLAACAGMALVPPLPQDPAYHAFADRRSWWGIPNTADVLSNAGFLLVGAVALRDLALRRPGWLPWQRAAWALVFGGVLLTAFGSAWYHLEPTNERLFWDRLPMSVVFPAFAALAITDRLEREALLRPLLPVLALLGPASVLWWRASEARGAGDLRPYGLVQFLPALLVAVAAWLRPPRRLATRALSAVLVWYALAKALEALDHEVLAWTGVVGGHALKHLAAAAAAEALRRGFRQGTTAPAVGSAQAA